MTTRRGLLAFLGLAPFAPALLKAAPSAAAPLAPLDLPGTIGFPGPRTIWDLRDLTSEETRMLMTAGEVPGVIKDLDWSDDYLERMRRGAEGLGRRIVNALEEQIGRIEVLTPQADENTDWDEVARIDARIAEERGR